MDDTVYLIKNIEEYGKLISFCIDHDITVWRTYWDERDKGTIGYHIDWKQKRCFYSKINYWKGMNIDNKVYNVVEPIFSFDKYGKVELTNQHEDKGDDIVMEDLIENINLTMKKRNYILHSTNGDNSVLHYMTPIGEKPNICCDVFIKENNYVEFMFRYLTKRCVILTTDKIGCFFDDNHFNKFEVEFLKLATALYNFEHKDKGE